MITGQTLQLKQWTKALNSYFTEDTQMINPLAVPSAWDALPAHICLTKSLRYFSLFNFYFLSEASSPGTSLTATLSPKLSPPHTSSKSPHSVFSFYHSLPTTL